jgi:predicted RNA-binding protein with RPS1 domain
VCVFDQQLRFQHALAAVQEVEGRGAKKGEVYRVRVLRVVDFGAYVALPNGLPALLHVSELSHEKIREVRDVVAEGQEFDVVCKGRDSKGFVLLSLKDLLPNPHAQQGQGESSSSRESAMAAAISLQDKLAAAVAAAAAGAVDDSSGSSSSHCSSGGSIGRLTQQHHVHHSIKPAASSSSSGSSNNGGKSWRPRAMTWRPPAAAQQPFRPAQQQPSVQSEEQQ